MRSQPKDFITPLIRDLGAVLVKGIRPREIFAQYMAKAWGPSGGRDLNIHFGDMDKGFIGPISHLGDMIPGDDRRAARRRACKRSRSWPLPTLATAA